MSSVLLPNACCVCSAHVSAVGESVALRCSCLILLCQNCAKEQISQMENTFESYLTCPICSHSTDLSLLIDDTSVVSEYMVTIISDEFQRSGILTPSSIHRASINKLMLLVEGMRKRGVNVTKIQNITEVNLLKLQLALLIHGTRFPNDPPLMSRIKIRSSAFYERMLSEMQNGEQLIPRKIVCHVCDNPIHKGQSVNLTCDCTDYICRDCAYKTIAGCWHAEEGNHAYHSGCIRCPNCRSLSRVIGNIDAARQYETTLVLNGLHHYFHSKCGQKEIVALKKLYMAYYMDGFKGTILPGEFIEVGPRANKSRSVHIMRLEIARLELLRVNGLRYTGDTPPQENQLKYLGPLSKLTIETHKYIELFLLEPDEPRVPIWLDEPTVVNSPQTVAHPATSTLALRTVSTPCPHCTVNPYDEVYLQQHMGNFHPHLPTPTPSTVSASASGAADMDDVTMTTDSLLDSEMYWTDEEQTIPGDKAMWDTGWSGARSKAVWSSDGSPDGRCETPPVVGQGCSPVPHGMDEIEELDDIVTSSVRSSTQGTVHRSQSPIHPSQRWSLSSSVSGSTAMEGVVIGESAKVASTVASQQTHVNVAPAGLGRSLNISPPPASRLPVSAKVTKPTPKVPAAVLKRINREVNSAAASAAEGAKPKPKPEYVRSYKRPASAMDVDADRDNVQNVAPQMAPPAVLSSPAVVGITSCLSKAASSQQSPASSQPPSKRAKTVRFGENEVFTIANRHELKATQAHEPTAENGTSSVYQPIAPATASHVAPRSTLPYPMPLQPSSHAQPAQPMRPPQPFTPPPPPSPVVSSELPLTRRALPPQATPAHPQSPPPLLAPPVSKSCLLRTGGDWASSSHITDDGRVIKLNCNPFAVHPNNNNKQQSSSGNNSNSMFANERNTNTNNSASLLPQGTELTDVMRKLKQCFQPIPNQPEPWQPAAPLALNTAAEAANRYNSQPYIPPYGPLQAHRIRDSPPVNRILSSNSSSSSSSSNRHVAHSAQSPSSDSARRTTINPSNVFAALTSPDCTVMAFEDRRGDRAIAANTDNSTAVTADTVSTAMVSNESKPCAPATACTTVAIAPFHEPSTLTPAALSTAPTIREVLDSIDMGGMGEFVVHLPVSKARLADAKTFKPPNTYYFTARIYFDPHYEVSEQLQSEYTAAFLQTDEKGGKYFETSFCCFGSATLLTGVLSQLKGKGGFRGIVHQFMDCKGLYFKNKSTLRDCQLGERSVIEVRPKMLHTTTATATATATLTVIKSQPQQQLKIELPQQPHSSAAVMAKGSGSFSAALASYTRH